MPRASVNNKKMTNVALSNGEHVMGIRKNPEDETYGDQKLAGDAMEMPIGRPLRYTPGLRCDAHLESLRPERAGNHRAIQVLFFKRARKKFEKYNVRRTRTLMRIISDIHSVL